jgi:hypothetical protein
MDWTRIVTYALASICGAIALLKPVLSPIFLPIATGLAGWSTTHPGDAKTTAVTVNTAVESALKTVAQSFAPKFK